MLENLGLCEKDFLAYPKIHKQRREKKILFTYSKSLFDENNMSFWIVDSSVNNYICSSSSLISSTIELK